MNRYVAYANIILVNFSLIVFSQAVYSANCGESSPSVKMGIDPRSPIELVELKADEIDNILTLFKALKGKWKGAAQESQCVARDGEDKELIQEYSTELTATLSNKDTLEMEFDLDSSSTTKNYIEKIFLDKKYLMFKDGPFNFVVNILYSKEDSISYLRKTKFAGRGNISIEVVRTIKVPSANSLMIEDVSYTNGVLSSKARYELK